MRQKRLLRRPRWLAVITVFFLGIAATANQAAAAPLSPLTGGGCNPTNQNGWAISACISEAPGSVLKPDYYINGKPSSYPSGSNCTIDTFVIDNTSGSVTI